MNSKYPHKEIKRRPRDRFNEATYEIFTIFNFRIYNSYISNSIFFISDRIRRRGINRPESESEIYNDEAGTYSGLVKNVK